MSRIQWNAPGSRRFETGVDLVVLYPPAGPGVAWNGVVSVDEEAVGGDLQPLYFDGVKYMDLTTGEDFQASITAFSSPPEFDQCDGVKTLVPGLTVGNQRRRTFGLCYRTLIGNDLVGADLGYKLHLVYNITASPSARQNQTIARDISAGTRSWKLSAVPPASLTFKPTAHVVLDSTIIEPRQMEQIEGLLYGRQGQAAYLPTVAQIVDNLATPITEYITEYI